MKPILCSLLLSLVFISPFYSCAEETVILVADAGYTDDQPSQSINEIQASLYIENASGISLLKGSYDHPYDAANFQIVWQSSVDTENSYVETTYESIRFTVYFSTPISTNDHQNVFTAKPIPSSIYSTGLKQAFLMHAVHCTWIEAEAYGEKGASHSIEFHTDPTLKSTDYGIPFSVYAEGFPQKVEKVFLSSMDGTEFYPLHEMRGFEDTGTHEVRYINQGGIVIGISAYPYYPLSFIVQTVNGKRYEFNDLPRDEYFDTIRLLYTPSSVNNWENY